MKGDIGFPQFRQWFAWSDRKKIKILFNWFSSIWTHRFV